MKKITMRKLFIICKRLFLVCIYTYSVFVFTSCANDKKADGREIYIPILADASWLMSDGAFISGVELAVEELNNEYSDVKFVAKIAVLDDKGQYETGVELASEVAEDRAVTAVFNLQNFDVSKTTADILSRSGKLTIFPYGAFDSLFTRDDPNVFCGVPAFSDLGMAMADYAVKKGYKKVAVYHNGTQSQEELSTAFELELLSAGTKVVDYVPSIASENDFDSIYSRWRALEVDCVVIAQYGLERAFEVLGMLRSRDSKMAVIGEPIFNRANALAENTTIAEGMAIPSTLAIKNGEKLKDFRERYRERFGREADIWAVQGYDMIRMVVETAVRIDSNDPEKLAQALHDQSGYQGIGRHIAFTAGGALINDVEELPILICKNGAFR